MSIRCRCGSSRIPGVARPVGVRHCILIWVVWHSRNGVDRSLGPFASRVRSI